MSANVNFGALVLVIYGLYLFSNVQACLPDSDDLAAVVRSSPVVLEGRVELSQPSAFQPSDSELFDVVISVRTVFKGQLDRSIDDESFEQIVVGPSGTSEDEDDCTVAPLAVGGEFIVFLNASGDSSADVSLRYFRLIARPRLADQESRAIAKEYGCYPECTTSSKKNSHVHLCADNDYCLNGGTCYVMLTLGLRFCQCAPEFQDVRCQEKQTKIGEKKTSEEGPVKEFFFLIVIGSMAALLVLLAICILVIFLVRWQTTKAKAAQLPEDHRLIKYRNISTDPENISTPEDSPPTDRVQISATQSNVRVQTDSTSGAPKPGRSNRNNGVGKTPKNGATPGDKSARGERLSQHRQPQGILSQGPPHRRTGLNGLSKTEELPVARVPAKNSNVVLVSNRGRDLQTNRGRDLQTNRGHDLPTNRGQGANNCATDGVWIERSLAGDGSILRVGRSDGLNLAKESMDSKSESTAV